MGNINLPDIFWIGNMEAGICYKEKFQSVAQICSDGVR